MYNNSDQKVRPADWPQTRRKEGTLSMSTDSTSPVYASEQRPWLAFYDSKYINQTLPACTAFEYGLPAE